MTSIQITNDTFKREVLDHKGVVLVDFYADWCGPCKVVAPILDELSKKYKDVLFAKVDIDKNQDLASKYSIFSIPTFLIIKNGDVKNQFVGAQSREGFESEIKKVVNG